MNARPGDDAVNYSQKLDQAIERLHDEGRYRTFIDIERKKGAFPHATWRRPDGTERPVTVWCDTGNLGRHNLLCDRER